MLFTFHISDASKSDLGCTPELGQTVSHSIRAVGCHRPAELLRCFLLGRECQSSRPICVLQVETPTAQGCVCMCMCACACVHHFSSSTMFV